MLGDEVEILADNDRIKSINIEIKDNPMRELSGRIAYNPSFQIEFEVEINPAMTVKLDHVS